MIALILALSLGQAPVLTLQEAYQRAQANNLDLKVAHTRLEQANLLREKVWTHQLPQLEVIGSYLHSSQELSLKVPNGFYLRELGTNTLNGPAYDPSRAVSTANPPGTPSNTIIVPSGYDTTTLLKQNQLSAVAILTVPLLVPELWPKFDEASLAQQLAADSVEAARRELLFGVAQLYYGVTSLKQAITVQERLLENARAHEREATVRVQAGALPRIALVRAQLDRTRAEQDVLRAKNSFASARSALAALLDRDEDFDVTAPAEPIVPEDLGAAQDKAVERRADLKVSRQQLELSQATAKSGYFKYAPNIAATGLALTSNNNAFNTEPVLWSVSLMARWTLFDGGAREVELKENRLKAIEAGTALASATAKARDEVRRAVLELNSARANRLKAQEQVALARENESITATNFSAGGASPVEVSDASTGLANAEIAVVAETLNSQLAALRLLRATGLFNPVEK